MALNNKNINNYFYVFLISHLIIWTVIPSFTNNNLPLDTIEALAWGSNLDWGFNKHPPMSAVMVEIFYQIFGSNDWAYYFLSQICLIICFYVIYNFSSDLFSKKIFSLISVLLLEGIYFYNYTSPEFNVYVAEIPFWALSVYFCWKGIKNNKIIDWFLLGTFSAFGLLSHYLFIYILITIILICFFFNKINKLSFKFLYSLIPFFLMFYPHLNWILENDFVTLKYGIHRTGSEDRNLLNHFVLPIIFFLKQLGVLIPFFIIFYFINKKFKLNLNYKDKNFVFLLIINFMPFILIFLTSLVLGIKIRTMWMTPFYIFLGLFFVYVSQSFIKTNNLKSFLVAFLIFFTFSPFAYAYVSITKTDKRTDYQGKKIAKIINEEWEKYSKGEFELESVIGDEWVAGNLSYHLKSRPKWYSFSKNSGKLKGGLIIANHPDINCNNEFVAVFKVIKLDIEGKPCFVMFKNRN